jgi:uncharacterized protein GlcG (DUF336 family)
MRRSFNFLAATTMSLTIGSSAIAEENKAIVTYASLALETALDLAQQALKTCSEEGSPVAVSVVDRGGNLQVTLRGRFAGPHTTDVAFRKAWTALTLRADTIDVARETESGPLSGVRNAHGVLPVGGGVQIRHGNGSVLGAVGVAGAPSPEIDHKCAKAGIAAIEDRIAF